MSWFHQGHTYSGVVGLLAFFASLLLLGRHLDGRPGWRRASLLGRAGFLWFGLYSAGVAAMTVLFTPGLGVAQRLQILICSCWLVVLALSPRAGVTGPTGPGAVRRTSAAPPCRARAARGRREVIPMADVRHGRFSAEIDGDFVVFLIGARLNKPWLVLKSIVDLGEPRRGMKAMLDELMAHPEKGLLGYRMGFPVIVQYWRSFEHLEAFARDPGDLHRPTWLAWFRRDRRGRTGIWHETFLVRAGEYEAVYGMCRRPGWPRRASRAGGGRQFGSTPPALGRDHERLAAGVRAPPSPTAQLRSPRTACPPVLPTSTAHSAVVTFSGLKRAESPVAVHELVFSRPPRN